MEFNPQPLNTRRRREQILQPFVLIFLIPLMMPMFAMAVSAQPMNEPLITKERPR